jgi:predicted aspartyl protease
VPFEYLKHVLKIPVRAGGIETSFILDTGIGVSLISQALAERAGVVADGSSFTGQRMSGQDVTVPLGTLSTLTVGEQTGENVPVGIFDMQSMAGLEGVEGFVSLTFFRTTPLTIDYAARRVIVEDEASLARRAESGVAVTVEVDYDRCSTDVRLGVDLPSGRSIIVEVDTGSEGVTLDESLAADVGVDLGAASTRTQEGSDETGHKFVRYFATVDGDVSVTGAPDFVVSRPEAMFQKIIYQGLVGDAFLRNFTTTYDLVGSRMIFNRPE